MGKKIFVLDRGVASIKVALVEVASSRLKIINAYRVPMPEGSSLEEFSPKIKAILKTHKIKGVPLVFSLPLAQAMIRELHLPFSDRRRVAQSIIYEMESHIPLPIEEVVVDFHPLDLPGSQGTDLIALAFQKEFVTHNFGLVKDFLPGKIIMDVDAFALYNLWAWQNPGSEGKVLLLDMGEKRTLLLLMEGGKLRLIRNISWGSSSITRSISKALQIEWENAEEVKRERGELLPPSEGDEEQRKISRAIGKSLRELEVEIERTLLEKMEVEEIEEVLLSGGGSLIKGLDEYLTRRFQGNIRWLNTLDKVEFPASLASSLPPATLSVCMGLALRNLKRAEIKVDFLKEEVLPLSYRKRKPLLTPLLITVSLLFALSIVDLHLKVRLEEKRYRLLHQEIVDVFKRTFPQSRRIISPLEQMRNKLREIREKTRSLQEATSGQVSSLLLLREISQRVPGEIKVVVTDMSIGPEGVELSGRTDSFEKVDRLKESLQASPYFPEVRITGARLSSDKSGVEFSLTLYLAKKER